MKNAYENKKSNYINAFYYRHQERRDVWGLPDEVADGAIEFLEDIMCEDWDGDAVLDYDNLAINAEYVAKDEAQENYGKSAEELEEDALFVTENYIILSW